MDRMSHHGHNCTLLDTHLSVESYREGSFFKEGVKYTMDKN